MVDISRYSFVNMKSILLKMLLVEKNTNKFKILFVKQSEKPLKQCNFRSVEPIGCGCAYRGRYTLHRSQTVLSLQNTAHC